MLNDVCVLKLDLLFRYYFIEFYLFFRLNSYHGGTKNVVCLQVFLNFFLPLFLLSHLLFPLLFSILPFVFLQFLIPFPQKLPCYSFIFFINCCKIMSWSSILRSWILLSVHFLPLLLLTHPSWLIHFLYNPLLFSHCNRIEFLRYSWRNSLLWQWFFRVKDWIFVIYWLFKVNYFMVDLLWILSIVSWDWIWLCCSRFIFWVFILILSQIDSSLLSLHSFRPFTIHK